MNVNMLMIRIAGTRKDDHHFEDDISGSDDGDIIDTIDWKSGPRDTQNEQVDTGEVTYEVFERDFYPKIWRKTFPGKKDANQQNFHPMLVWNEITSFIKGLSQVTLYNCFVKTRLCFGNFSIEQTTTTLQNKNKNHNQKKKKKQKKTNKVK